MMLPLNSLGINNIIYIQHLTVLKTINSGTINPKAFLFLLGYTIALFMGFLKVTTLLSLKIVCLRQNESYVYNF